MGQAATPESARLRRTFGGDEGMRRYVAALFDLLSETLGREKMILRAGKLDALKLMRSALLPERILALQRLVFEDPTLARLPQPGKYREAIAEVEDGLAEIVAQRSVEERIEKKINVKLAERHHEYLHDLKVEALREDGGPETPATAQRLLELEKLDERKLAASALAMLRPASLDDVVGQVDAIRALLAKIASPFPQHVIVYGPPGVGKTTVARLALEVAKQRARTPFAIDAPFVEASGATLRWDPRESTNPLLGSVHDPIYQGSRREFAEAGIPEPKLGLVSRAHGGMLFIDELGEMDPMLQTKLLKVLEDKRFFFESSYYDESDPSVPAYVKKLFRDGAPADFVLVGATTRDPSEIDPAIRSRCAEVYFESLAEAQIRDIVTGAAKRLGVKLDRHVPARVASYTMEGRKAVQILADAYGHALFRATERDALAKHEPVAKSRGTAAPKRGAKAASKPAAKHRGVCTESDNVDLGGNRAATEVIVAISEEDIAAVVRAGRLVPHSPVRAARTPAVGKSFGLGVAHHVGSPIEIEAAVFPAGEARKGTVRFNETAGTMARDSVFNATSVIRSIAGIDPIDFDLHVNVIGGGNIDGPSAGLAIFLAVYSALSGRPIPQDVAITGELSISGKIRPVGGIVEKLHAARQSGMRLVIVPKENAHDVPREPGVEVVLVGSVAEAFDALGLARLAVKRRANLLARP